MTRHTIAVALLLLSFGAAAHDIPADVRVNAFVRAQGKQLEL